MWKLAPVFLEAAANRNQNSGDGQRAGSNPILYDSRGNPLHFTQMHQVSNNPPDGLQSSPLTQCVWTFFWLGVIIFIAYPFAFCACELYVLLSPLSALCPKFSPVTDFFFKISQLPSICAKNMIEAKPIISM